LARPYDEHRQHGVPHDALCDATEEETLKSAPPVATENDEIRNL
jgi:hypothetical protein